MPIFYQLKTVILLAIILLGVAALSLFYWRGTHSATTKADLRVAREAIKVEREALKITHTIDMRVNAEGIQTAKTAQEAASEIDYIRTARSAGTSDATVVADLSGQSVGGADGRCDSACARVLQLAREARAAALASGARLQSEGAGPR